MVEGKVVWDMWTGEEPVCRVFVDRCGGASMAFMCRQRVEASMCVLTLVL